jgi:hypothetical protein
LKEERVFRYTLRRPDFIGLRLVKDLAMYLTVVGCVTAVCILQADDCEARLNRLMRESYYQQKAELAAWRWSESENSIMFCVANRLNQYDVKVVRMAAPASWIDALRLEIWDKNVQLAAFNAHFESVFAAKGDVVYFAKLVPMAAGCEVIAFDLKEKRELWKCYLRGNPPRSHSKYRHQVTIDFEDGVVVVHGKESNGRYIEYIDPTSGTTIGHRKLLREPQP